MKSDLQRFIRLGNSRNDTPFRGHLAQRVRRTWGDFRVVDLGHRGGHRAILLANLKLAVSRERLLALEQKLEFGDQLVAKRMHFGQVTGGIGGAAGRHQFEHVSSQSVEMLI